MEPRLLQRIALPPRGVGDALRNARTFCFFFRLGHIRAEQSDAAPHQWMNIRIERIKKGRYEKPGSGPAHLMNVIQDLWEPFFKVESGDDLGLVEVQHEPVSVVIVADILVIEPRKRSILVLRVN